MVMVPVRPRVRCPISVEKSGASTGRGRLLRADGGTGGVMTTMGAGEKAGDSCGGVPVGRAPAAGDPRRREPAKPTPCRLTVIMPRWMRIDMPCVVMWRRCGRLGDDAVDRSGRLNIPRRSRG